MVENPVCNNVALLTGAFSGIGRELALQIAKAAAAHRREIIESRRGRLGRWLEAFAPGLVDRIALRGFERGK